MSIYFELAGEVIRLATYQSQTLVRNRHLGVQLGVRDIPSRRGVVVHCIVVASVDEAN
jgi:hypothetical protein